MLDFGRLRAGVDGWRGSFEALVRQLGRANPPEDAVEFRHINGAGGDGGIEAYWILSDDFEHGYQAKFHAKPGDIDWTALDSSILTALETHPRLKSVQVAVACDLTAQVARPRGRSGWQHWETHRQKWIAVAEAAGRTVTFSFWGASEIEQMLAAPSAAGLREYWFGESPISASWLRSEFERTIGMLEDRYHPEDHVEVGIRTVFDGLRRTKQWRERLSTRHAKVLEHDIRLPRNDTFAEVESALATLTGRVRLFAECASDVDLPPERTFPISAWTDLTISIRDAVYGASQAVSRLSPEETPNLNPSVNPNETRTRLQGDLRSLRNAIDEVEHALEDSAQVADQHRFAIVIGRAGSGKSHLLASEVNKALADGEPALMLLGTDFAGVEPPEIQLLRRLGLTHLSIDAFFGSLSASAEVVGSRALLVIDAVNEGAGAKLWRERLVAFAAMLLKFERVVLCVSCRTEFADYLLTDAAKKAAVSVNVPGFVTAEEQDAAARVYLDGRGILRPATPWLSPEFSNPLFLRTTCIALEREGKREFPRGLRGTREMLRFYLDTTARHLDTVHDGSDDLIVPLRKAVLILASKMASTRSDFVERDVAARIVDAAFAGFAAPSEWGWVDRLRLRGILRTDPHPNADVTDPLTISQDVSASVSSASKTT